ncbi:A disintegrin and metalloproteinase with thrombospondin motifs adt-2-like [Anoplophora glabripennis]|uniref:A disintegrin and metalloproteinase with thrombospondin motifs adt-2-like n=1 Tax=Anoplophora glabripennis TaxID=217634 RepID=UPI0008744D85|nr:A disintegrin and metalloproteinase with thrombospondin motifs adt-2-like [Anoplophora glabripennis]
MFVHLLIYLILLKNCVFVNTLLLEALHDYMTEPELAYYFQTADRSIIPDYEVIYLPLVLPVKEASSVFGDEDEEIEYNFSAFQRPIELKLRRNPSITASNFKTYIHNHDKIESLPDSPKNCHYLHKDRSTVASISICSPRTVQGLVFLENSTLEIHPLTERLQTLLKLREPLVETLLDEEVKMPHIVKRANFLTDFLNYDILPIAGNVWTENEEVNPSVYDNNFNKVNRYDWSYPEAASYRPAGGLTLELALFFDEAAYKIFAPHFNNDDKKLQDMLLAYMNGVQALYHHPSLGTILELVLVRLDIMKQQPSAMPHYNGERGKLLDSFCAYQKGINPSGDSNPDHWDMALYVSGLDFFAYEKGRKSGVTMGLATVGGVCLDQYACVIAEFGTTNIFGKPYPSAGFTSVYISAHEIGHNLGMHHDNSGNSCPKEGYIMSPSRGTNGETQWSTCSADVMAKLSWAKCLQDSGKSPKNLDHSHFLDTPGQIFTAKRQCELLLRDKDATMLPHQELSTICYNLQCKTPHRSGYYFAGPALDGTQCGKGKYCYGGNCVDKQPPKPVKNVPGGWGPWKEGNCNSGCIEKSMGHAMKRRYCNNPTPINTDEGCEGASVEFELCSDNKICKYKKESVVDYASERCKEFAKLLPELDRTGAGLQAPHEEGRVWMGCAIFCKRADSGSYYTPRIELNDLGVSPYFPDGTWCHREKNLNFYCIQHHCLPENFKFTKSEVGGDDIPFSQNAHPLQEIPQEIKDYFSLGPNGKPIRTTLHSAKQPKEEDWETNDYIEIPELKDRYKMLPYDRENFI